MKEKNNIIKYVEIIIVVLAVCATTGCGFNFKNKSLDEAKTDNTLEKKETDNNNFKDDAKELIYKFDANFSDIKRVNGKVNIYVFWGNGCPHCSELHSFFDTIKDKYKEYFNLYGFEIWYDANNNNMAKKFAESMGNTLSGVPYYIIGEKSFSGYASSKDEEIINAIIEGSKKTYDVYFDKIK